MIPGGKIEISQIVQKKLRTYHKYTGGAVWTAMIKYSIDVENFRYLEGYQYFGKLLGSKYSKLIVQPQLVPSSSVATPKRASLILLSCEELE